MENSMLQTLLQVFFNGSSFVVCIWLSFHLSAAACHLPKTKNKVEEAAEEILVALYNEFIKNLVALESAPAWSCPCPVTNKGKSKNKPFRPCGTKLKKIVEAVRQSHTELLQELREFDEMRFYCEEFVNMNEKFLLDMVEELVCSHHRNMVIRAMRAVARRKDRKIFLSQPNEHEVDWSSTNLAGEYAKPLADPLPANTTSAEICSDIKVACEMAEVAKRDASKQVLFVTPRKQIIPDRESAFTAGKGHSDSHQFPRVPQSPPCDDDVSMASASPYSDASDFSMPSQADTPDTEIIAPSKTDLVQRDRDELPPSPTPVGRTRQRQIIQPRNNPKPNEQLEPYQKSPCTDTQLPPRPSLQHFPPKGQQKSSPKKQTATSQKPQEVGHLKTKKRTKNESLVLRSLLKSELEPGFIYIARDPEDKELEGCHKMGFTKRSIWERYKNDKCGRYKRMLYLARSYVPLEHAMKVEKLVQNDLFDKRMRIRYCSHCAPSGHTEWFKVDALNLKDSINKWSRFMSTKPYDANGKLNPEGKALWDRMKEAHSPADETNAVVQFFPRAMPLSAVHVVENVWDIERKIGDMMKMARALSTNAKTLMDTPAEWDEFIACNQWNSLLLESHKRWIGGLSLEVDLISSSASAPTKKVDGQRNQDVLTADYILSVTKDDRQIDVEE